MSPVPAPAAEHTDMVLVKQAYRFALDPNQGQLHALASHAGGSRYAWNWGLARVKEALDRRAAGEDLKIPTAYDLCKAWTAWKDGPQGPVWVGENSATIYQQALRDVEKAMKAFWDSRTGKRRGRRVGFPRFKKKGRAPDRFRVVGSIPVTSRHVQLPRIGRVKLHEDPAGLVAAVAAGRVTIKSATVCREGHRWFVSLSVEAWRPAPAAAASGAPIGIDLGLSHFATFSDGRVADAPRPLRIELAKLRRLSREHSRKVKGSNRRRKAALKLARRHARIRNIRNDFLHKLTTELAQSHGRFVIEDLAVANMVRRPRPSVDPERPEHFLANGRRRKGGLNRAISDSSWAEFRRQLEYKAAWYGSELVVADRWFASSKLCSGCGNHNDGLTLADRVFRCPACGVVLDRDLNAARNLADRPAKLEPVA